MSPSIGHARSGFHFAFYKSTEPLLVFVVLGHRVANIRLCFPTLFLASFLNFAPVFLLS